MRAIARALRHLNHEVQRRVVRWVVARFNEGGFTDPEATPTESVDSALADTGEKDGGK